MGGTTTIGDGATLILSNPTARTIASGHRLFNSTNGTWKDTGGCDGVTEVCDSWTAVTADADTDTDDDGLPNNEELTLGTDPFDADTDDGGVNDGDEVDNGSDPAERPRCNQYRGRRLL